ncbi:hypothetical protein K6U06_04260 [Acidiferrimicrobium sp. IK]|uniref:hypothetical protein n=1 Tax=Acidiferrimicrobium sp. IK TaxID=2871700 RepID=UPI0021CAF34F|nr:hypothetical protein [Acidiferrimicrobium sp. IK]MCU4183561.1 hypothetical protein [Acidiferrimicrobium sp. IK]
MVIEPAAGHAEGLGHGGEGDARSHETWQTLASVLLSEGVSVAAAEYLGDSPSVVLGTYAHLMPADHDRARAAVETAFRGAPLRALRTVALSGRATEPLTRDFAAERARLTR